MEFKAVGKNILITPQKSPTMTPGGVQLPEGYNQSRIAGVVSVGEQVKVVNPGQLIVYKPQTGYQVESNRIVIEEDDILLVKK